MSNPFRYGAVVTGEYFTDREAELAEILADIRSGQNLVVISPRQYGKTSLIVRAIEQLRQEKVLVAYLDLFLTPTKDRFADRLADVIYGGLVAPFERVVQKATDIFQSLPIRPRITINTDGTPSFEFGPGEHSRDIDRTIEGLLGLPGSISKERKRRVALVLDEFQEVVKLDPHLIATMRSVFQMQSDVSHVFLGSERHLMEQVFTRDNEPMYRLAKPFALQKIGAEDLASFIRGRFVASGREIAEDAIEAILSITKCLPYATQEMCYFTWSIAAAENLPATVDVVRRALRRVLEAEDARCKALWYQHTSVQRKVLIALATAKGNGVLSEEYRQRHRLGAASSVQAALKRLVDEDLVEHAPLGPYEIRDVFFLMWLRRLVDSGISSIAQDTYF